MLVDFSKPSVILCIGRPRKGKSNMMKYLLLDGAVRQKQLQFGLIFCGTKYSGDYDFIPQEYVIEGYDENIFRKYVAKLRDMKKEGIEIPPNFVVFDDLLGILSNDNGFLLNFIIQHRHFSCNIILNAQYINKGASTTLRECTTHAFMFNSKTKRTIESLYECFGQLFENIKEFKYNFLDITNMPYTCCMFEQDEDDVDKNYKIVKAPDMTKVDIQIEY